MEVDSGTRHNTQALTHFGEIRHKSSDQSSPTQEFSVSGTELHMLETGILVVSCHVLEHRCGETLYTVA